MKKLLAIILTVVMLLGVVAISTTAAEATPKVTIVTNEGSAVAKGVTTYFTVRFDNFASIKGIDVTITADQNIELGKVTTTGFPTAGKDVNYTEENEGTEHTIRFVDLTSGSDGKIIFEATVPENAVTTGDPSITVIGKYAEDGKTLFEVTAPAAGTFELVKEIATTPVETEQTVTAPANKFIPYGSVYTGSSDNATFVEKNADGTFTAPAGAVYQSFDVPSNGITTFGASNDNEYSDRLRFGSYSNLNDGAKEHGTLVFEGDWLALKNFYIQNGYTVQQFVKSLYNDVTAKLAANPNAKFVYYNLGDGKTINVYRFVQQNYMWKGGNVLEYAVRLNGIKADTTYTGVAYSIASDNTVTISENVKSVTK